MKQISFDESTNTPNNDYIQIIKLKRAAYQERKHLRNGKIFLIIMTVLSGPGLLSSMELYSLIILGLFVSSIFLLKRYPIPIFGGYFGLYLITLFYGLYTTLSTTGFKLLLIVALIFPAITLYFLGKAFFGALNRKKSVTQLVDFKVDVSRV